MKDKSRLLIMLLVALALVAAACGGDDDDASSSDQPADSEDAADGAGDSGAAGSAVQVTAVDIEAGTATVTNTGSEAADLGGHWLCNRPAYVQLPNEALEAGESIDVPLGGLAAGAGEVGIYTSDNFANSADIISYVTWGGGGGRQSVAESGGVWNGSPVPEPTSGLELTGNPGSAEGWSG
ncbi:MAG: hypothetical protein ACR2PK_18595 [Acidimicrobiales bacterium]